LQENQKIVLKNNSDSKTNFSSIKLYIQIKLSHTRNVKKNTTHVQYPERKLPKNKKQKKAKTREGEKKFKQPQDQQQ
jgi:hypothetical protein